MSRRRPAVAGQFYEGREKPLHAQIIDSFSSDRGPGASPLSAPHARADERSLRGLIVPHAGLVFSGAIAAFSYAAMAADGLPETVVVMGPKHGFYGSGIGTDDRPWETPLGETTPDSDLVHALELRGLPIDHEIHSGEHSIEVQVPFIQYLNSLSDRPAQFVPICIRDQSLDRARKTATILREVLEDRNVVLVASTDFCHYIPASEAARRDEYALKAIEAGDAAALDAAIRDHDISMCGYGAVMTLLEAVQPSKVERLRYGSSGEVLDRDSVVAYAALAVT